MLENIYLPKAKKLPNHLCKFKLGCKQAVKPKTVVVLLTLAALLLTIKAGFLFWQKWQHDLRLELIKSDLDTFWQKLDRTEIPEVVINDTPEATVAAEIQRLWGSQEQAEREHRQEVIKLINEQRQIVNNQTPDVYPLLELKNHPTLEQSARRSFENIAENKRFEHQDLTVLLSRGEPFDRVGENLAAENNVNPVRVVYDWYLSESHRELMLGDWEFVGVWSGWVEGLEIEGKPTQDWYVTVAHFGET